MDNNGQNHSKNSALIHFLGTIDELNSHLGLVKVLICGDENKQFLEGIQKKLMKIMSHIVEPANENYLINYEEITVLEEEIDKHKKTLPELSGFVLPGSSAAEAQIHIARTVARRAERYFFAVTGYEICQIAGEYLNRLSNYLFILSQKENY